MSLGARERMGDLQPRQGTLPVPGGRVSYRIVGRGPGIPLLTLHGGPGSGWISLAPLQAVGADRPVIFYDQLGCGRSPARDPGLWTMARFIAEIDAVRAHLGLARVHLLGHSWGGMLALDYLLTRPQGVQSVVFSNSMASISAFHGEAWRLVDAMPGWPRRRLHARSRRSLGYQASLLWFCLRHVVRLRWLPDPRPILASLLTMYASPAFPALWGWDDLHITGTLQSWERMDRLHEIETPALVIGGEHDEVTPRLVRALADGLPQSSLVVIPGASHLPFFERPRTYMQLLRPFLRAHDGVGVSPR